MTEPPRDPAAGESTGIARWQKLVGIIGLIVVLLLALLLFGPGSGGHGPGRHTPGEREQEPVEDGAAHGMSQWDH